MKLYVGNLPYSFTEQDLSDLFKDYAEFISAKLIADRDSGRSKGFGFVEIGSDEEGKKAIEELNKKDIDGREIVVNEARPREERPSFRKKRF